LLLLSVTGGERSHKPLTWTSGAGIVYVLFISITISVIGARVNDVDRLFAMSIQHFATTANHLQRVLKFIAFEILRTSIR